jgi:excinuclease ABC subunit A
VASGTPREVARTGTITGRWLRGEGLTVTSNGRRRPQGWLAIHGARANNLCGETVELPLGSLVGVCGVSGSGKSTLLIDTLGRALVRRTHTTSFAREPSDPGEHDAIEGAPARCLLVDQARRGVGSPAAFLGLAKPLLKLYAASEDAAALGLDAKQLGRRCSACKGSGQIRLQMGFLPDLFVACETCQGTGNVPEAWQVRLRGLALPEINALTLDQVYDLFGDVDKLARPLAVAREVGLGYLVWRQPAHALSGGEAQRLKIVKELARTPRGKSVRGRASQETLYILDEPTLGQHMEDVARLAAVLQRLVDAGHSVVVVEHHPHLLAACDWLLELGPGGGPAGGRVVAAGSPEEVARGDTPTAPYLRQTLGVGL